MVEQRELLEFDAVGLSALIRSGGTTVWIPNAAVSEKTTMNHSRLGGYRIEVVVPLDHNPDRALAAAVMEHALREISWFVPGREPLVCFDSIAGEAMIFRVYAWITDRTTEPVNRSELLTKLVRALEDEGISVGHTMNLSTHAPSPASV